MPRPFKRRRICCCDDDKPTTTHFRQLIKTLTFHQVASFDVVVRTSTLLTYNFWLPRRAKRSVCVFVTETVSVYLLALGQEVKRAEEARAVHTYIVPLFSLQLVFPFAVAFACCRFCCCYRLTSASVGGVTLKKPREKENQKRTRRRREKTNLATIKKKNRASGQSNFAQQRLGVDNCAVLLKVPRGHTSKDTRRDKKPSS